ncbi:P-loop containing nucleoside triphosphate hydrolase protein [Rhizoctonia solani]|uniref:RNA helicase n=1 Tax=Rhizoctonia solani TaxID=456999 RepID=A0A8H7M451_9AGAM|nr:P-loop containing nucleoside triphosphate hydrolase protein [Rhizoctonia solani]KAF8754295.1 P-loop containing nucleoside triphosphate hydrolase protein [Rhizoctonia solani]
MTKANKPPGFVPHSTFKQSPPYRKEYSHPMLCCTKASIAHKQFARSNRRAALERLSRRHNIIEFGRESDDEKFGATDIIGNNGTNSQIKETQGRQALLAERKRLPIWTGRRALVQAVKENDTLIVLGETGSGKTTRESKANKLFHTISSSCAIEVPQFLLGSGIAGNGMIAVTQPRKVAAISLANRVSIEHGTPVGETVGYAVRFDEKAGPNTRIKYLTDGMLVRELLLDPSLSRYSVIIVDEAHERTLRTDMLLGSLKRIQYDRNVGMGGEKANIKGKEKAISRDVSPLKIIVMSATLDAERFSQFFNRARIVYVKGRQHPVKLMYLKDNTSDYLDSALRTLFQIHINQPPGDILVFLAGQEDIETLEKAIQVYCNKPLTKPILVYPMYAALPSHQQSRIFQPPPKGSRKVILSTNIAETSITIPGVRYVIDSGMCKEKGYQSRNAGTGIETLTLCPISKSSAIQRAGRAGREGPGVCFRLYTEKAYGSLDETSLPEIQRCNLAFAALQLKCLQQDLSTTDLIDAPPSDAIATSLISLFGLNALDSTGHITPLGRKLAGFPLDPPFGRALIASEELGCLLDVIDILSILSASSKVMLDPPSEQREIALEARQKFMHRSGDHLTLLNILRAYLDALREALSIRSQLISTCKHMNMDATQKPGNASDSILKSLLAGLFMNTALLQPDGGYKQIVGQQIVKIHPASSLSGRKMTAIVFDELVYTSATYARGVSAIPRQWIMEVPFFAARGATQ